MILAELVKTRPCSYLQNLCVVLAVTLGGLVQAQDYDNDNYYNNYGEDNYNNYGNNSENYNNDNNYNYNQNYNQNYNEDTSSDNATTGDYADDVIGSEEPVTPDFKGTSIDENPYDYSGDGEATVVEEGNYVEYGSDPELPMQNNSLQQMDGAYSESSDVPLSKMKLEPIPLPNEFSGAPPISESLGVFGAGEAPSHYVIQEGDTLFDICDQLLDEPEYWPKLWSMNPEIRNPHYIWPGMVLRFYPGDDALPPFLEIQDEESLEPVILEGEYLVEDLVKAPLPKDPTDIYVTPPKFSEIVEWGQVEDFPVGRITVSEPLGVRVIKSVQPMFVYGERLDELGEVLGTYYGESSLRQEGVLRGVEDGVAQGRLYSVLRYSHSISHPNRLFYSAYQYLNVGTIKVSRLFEDQGKALFESQDTWFYIQEGDIIVEHIPSEHNIPRKNLPADDVNGTVVGFAFSDARIAGYGSYIVIDNPDLTVGSNVPLYRLRGRDVDQDESSVLKGLKDAYRYGEARVVDVSDVAAIAYVLDGRRAVEVGDRTTEELEDS